MAANALLYQEPGKVPSAVLAVMVHVLLAAFLFFGVRWQSRPPEAVMVELWDSPPAVEKVVAQPEPLPKPEVRPEPIVEKAVEPPKPDIALEKKKEVKKEIKKEPPKKPEPKLNLDRSKDIRAEAERETAALERSRILDQMKRETAAGISKAEAVAATSKAKATWIGAIVGKIKPNVVAQPNIPGNPEAIFDVTLLPTGEVLPPVRLRKSSGYKSYDEALERAILKSSPLPKPDRPELFERSLELKFRPLD
ncbi:MAG TPA: energy transducer TonB [Burkholderiales bacterium]